jgi:hypothetical protein
MECLVRSGAGAGLVVRDDPQQGERIDGAGYAVAPDSKGVAWSIEAELAYL